MIQISKSPNEMGKNLSCFNSDNSSFKSKVTLNNVVVKLN